MALVPANPSLSQPLKPPARIICRFSTTCYPQGFGSWLAPKLLCWTGLGLKRRRQIRSKECLARRVLAMHFSDFQHLFEEGPTELAYAGTPICDLHQYEQGRVCQKWTKKVLQEQNPEAEISDMEPGTCCNGTRRGPNQSICDFVLDNRRVEVKSTKMAWDSASQQWVVVFRRVKFRSGEHFAHAFDDLYLVILSPEGLHLIKHDLATGISTNGKFTEVSGHLIKINGSRSNTSWEKALRCIIWKLCTHGGCRLIAQRGFDEPGFLDSILCERTSSCSSYTTALVGIPMRNMSNKKRGDGIQNIGLAIDQILNPHSDISFVEGVDSSGRKRSTANASADWVRGTTRVELKSAGLCFDRTNSRWICLFQAMKPYFLDELWLAICSPIGIHFYRSESIQALGLAASGAATAHAGYQKCFGAPCGEGDPLKALKAIEARIISKGFQLIAVVEWEKGAQRPFRRQRGRTSLNERGSVDADAKHHYTNHSQPCRHVVSRSRRDP